jgi:hypothetical protein
MTGGSFALEVSSPSKEVMLHSKRLMISTAALIVFLATAVYLQWQWLSLIVPGAILVWIGLAMPAPSSEGTRIKKLAK